MATKVVVCPECESPVDAGRFSCSSCGAVVAAVASAARSFAPAPAVAPAPVEAVVPEPAVAASVVADRADPADDGWDLPEAEVEPDPVPEPVDATVPAPAAAAPDVHVPAPPATSWPETPQWPDPTIRVQPIPRPDESAWPVAAPTAPAVEPSPTGPMWPAAAATAPAIESDPRGPMWPAVSAAAPAVADVPDASAAVPLAPADPAPPAQQAWPPTGTGPMALEPPVRTPAGAYLPPSAVLPPGEALPVNGHHTNGHVAQSAAVEPSKTLAQRLALGDADGPLGLPVNAAGRTIALGAAIAGLGFLLPWAEIVIGSASMGGFLDMWGLAGPGHPIVLLLLIAIGFLAVAHEKWPVKVGAGTAAIVLGSVLLGLAFPYVMGPFREAVGVYVTAAGAVIMIAGGLLARVPRRHADDEARV